MIPEIQMVDLRSQYTRLKSDIDLAIKNVVESAAFINGPQVSEFRGALENYLQCNQVVTCGNGTDALQIAMMALEFKPGDEVIVPAFTYVATVEVLALLGIKPIFVDVNYDDFNIDTTKIEAAISNRTVGIVPVHLFGQCANMEPILKIARQYGIKVIEDNAQALGATYTFKNGHQQYAGTIGDIGTTSFFPSKNLGCFGDGGALSTNDINLGEHVRIIANHGQTVKYVHDKIGINSRLDTLQAAILKAKLIHIDDFANRRNGIANHYDTAFRNHAYITIPSRNSFSTHVFHQYTLKISDNKRDALKQYLADNKVPSMIYYPIPVHKQKAYETLNDRHDDLVVSETLCKEVLSIPIHTEMNMEEAKYISNKILDFFK